ncbi:MAG: hypothetical protein KC422_10090 [Trueperaceae bacterium]|nr:hypothetical protein [Trueperaceae bacterium]
MNSQLKKVLTGSGLLFSAMMIVNVLNYGYALVLGRLFGPVAYGAYASFISLFLLVSLLPLTLQQVTAKFAASKTSVAGFSSRLALASGIIFGLALLLLAQPLSPIIKLPASWLMGLGVFLPLYALMGTGRGEAQGEQAFVVLGSNMVLEHALKIALTPLALFFAPAASGAVLATLAAVPVTTFQLRRFFRLKLKSLMSPQEVGKYAAPIFVNLSAQAIIINTDVLLVNALLSSEEAGIYAAVALIGRIVFYGSWAISAAIFPMVAARAAEGKPHLDLLYIALGAVAFISLGVTGFCALFPKFVIGILFGQAYLAGISLIAPYALMTTLYSLANVVSNHYLALGSHKAGYWPLFAALIQVSLILGFHSTSLDIIWMQMLAKGGLLALLLMGASVGWFNKSQLKGARYVLR